MAMTIAAEAAGGRSASGSDAGVLPRGGTPRRSRRRRAGGSPRSSLSSCGSIDAKLDCLLSAVRQLVDAVCEKGSDTIVARRKKQRDESFQRLEKIPKLLEAKAGEEGHPGPAALRRVWEHGVPLGSEGSGGGRAGERVLPGRRGHRHDGHEGDGDGLSGPYSADGADAVSPYSQFSNPEDAIYERGSDPCQKRLDESFKRLEEIPKLLEAKAGDEGHPGPAAPLHAREHGVPLGSEGFGGVCGEARALPGRRGHRHGQRLSDPYSANDADAISPYSQFSNPEDAIYEKGSDPIVARKQKRLSECFKRLEEIPKLLEAEAGEEGHPGPAALLHAREHGVSLRSEVFTPVQ